MNLEEFKRISREHLINTYGDRPLAIIRAEGIRVWDSEGKEYLDFFSGIGVNNIGHRHPRVVEAILRQAQLLLHASNLYYTEPQLRLAHKLSNLFDGAKAFFCNSGAEANEAAIKLARKWGSTKNPPRYKVISCLGSFHGRTLATLSATGQEKVRKGFAPLPHGFHLVPFDDLQALSDAIDDETSAVLLEPIQGEGGVNVPRDGYLEGVMDICESRGILFILDEIQTGMGRTGRLFAHEHSSIKPHIMTLAKALAGGLPIGAMLARGEVAEALQPTEHASTFGGHPLSCAAAVATLEVLTDKGFLEEVQEMGRILMQNLREVRQTHRTIQEVRGKGLMIGLRLSIPASELVQSLRQKGIIVGIAGANVLRLLPPLIITVDEIQAFLSVLKASLAELEKQNP